MYPPDRLRIYVEYLRSRMTPEQLERARAADEARQRADALPTILPAGLLTDDELSRLRNAALPEPCRGRIDELPQDRRGVV